MFVQVFTTCASDNERSWLWFSDRIGGTHYFSNHNSEVEAPEPERSVRSSLSGVRRWMQVPGFVPNLSRNRTELRLFQELLIENACRQRQTALAAGVWSASPRRPVEDGPRSSTPLVLGGVRDSPFAGASERGTPAHATATAAAPSVLPLACAWEQAGAPAGSSGLGSDVPVRLEAHLLVKSGQISPWNTLANRL